FKALADNNIFVPLSFICARPFQVFSGGTAVFLDYHGLGHTYYGFVGLSAEKNARERTMFIHYVLYHKAVVERPEQVVLKKYIICRRDGSGCKSGRGVKIMTREQMAVYREYAKPMDVSYIIIPVRVDWKNTSMPYIDLVGYDPEALVQ